MREAGFYYNDKGKKVQLYDYVVLMCKIGGDAVKAEREAGENKQEVMLNALRTYKGYKIKAIFKLYPVDFEEDDR